MVGRPNVVGSQHCPVRIEPRCGQITEDSPEILVPKKARDVFQECETGSYFANDPDGVGPHVAGVVGAALLSGDAEGLAREARRDDIHDSTPGASVEIPHVRPDRERIEQAVRLAREEYRLPVGIVLDGADCSPAKQAGAEQAATGTGEESEFVKYTHAIGHF